MHTEVYRARPDVGSVIHGHPLYGTALGATDAGLLILTHDAVLFADGLGEFDEGPDLVTDAARGARVAAALGTRRAALLRNHGVVIAGEDVRWCGADGDRTLERAIRFQTIAAQPRRRSAPSAQETLDELQPQKYREAFMDEYWAAWVRRVERAQGPRPSEWPADVRIEPPINGGATPHRRRAAGAPARRAARPAGPDRRQALLRRAGLWHLHRARRRPAGQLVHLPGRRDRRSRGDDHRGLRDTPSTSASRRPSRATRRCSVASARRPWC